ncbi:MAG TPA: BamA/TamA family outer membrane protein [Polyangiaceae bacterium]|nr:BamA/TamA family outer membrane protein [Polyangiaceae bacterium]
MQLLASSLAHAQETPRALSGAYSAYEEEALRAAERELGSPRDEAAEGKPVEALVIRRLEPIEARDPVPQALNALHVESRESVIVREVVLVPGGRFSRALCDESARRLRTLPQLSLVLCVAVQGSTPGRVKVLILTKDTWSLFLDPDFDTSGGMLLLEPKEQNLFGLHHAAFVRYWHDPRSYSLGGDYRIPRLDGRFLSLLIDANVYVNRATSDLEGSYGALQAQGVPKSTRDPWAWFMDLGWKQQLARSYRMDVHRAPDDDRARVMDFEWHHRELYGVAALTRSWGWRYKTDVTAAFLATSVSDRRLDEQRNWADIAAVHVLENQMVVPYRRVGPLIELHLYTTDFLRTFEVETLGLQEDFRLGHDLLLDVNPAWRASELPGEPVGEFHSLVGASATAQETVAWADGFARIGVQGGADFQPEETDAAFVKGWLRAVTPRLGFGRLVVDGEATLALDDSRFRARPSYGNANRLRGSVNVTAASAAVVNLEYRTPALQLWTEQLGGVLFFDAGRFEQDGGGTIDKSAVGAGLRLVTPVLERSGLRFDLAVPLDSRGFDVAALMTQLTFGQAFGLPDVAPLKPRRLK